MHDFFRVQTQNIFTWFGNSNSCMKKETGVCSCVWFFFHIIFVCFSFCFDSFTTLRLLFKVSIDLFEWWQDCTMSAWISAWRVRVRVSMNLLSKNVLEFTSCGTLRLFLLSSTGGRWSTNFPYSMALVIGGVNDPSMWPRTEQRGWTG